MKGEKWATEAATAKFFQWASIHPSKQKIFDSLHISALGAGTYLGPADDATDRLYEEALLQATLSGVNLFDTAINYRCMRSERVVRKALRDLAGHGIERDQLFIATKGGFLPSEGMPAQFEEYVRIHYLDTGLIEASEIIADCHCMSAPFLENQIETSLVNLGLACIDLYFLHNPEIQLPECKEELFYQRITEAFRLFEKKVVEKKIARYGIASWNGFRQKKGGLQLAKILGCAKEAGGGEHHFRAIQLPFNFVMLEAMKSENQLIGKEKMTIFEAARELGVSIFISAPLMQSQVGGLCPRLFEKLPQERSPMLQALQFVLSTPQVTAAFVGMRQRAHCEEDRSVLSFPNWSNEVWKEACSALGAREE